MDTVDSIRSKSEGAKDLKSVVSAMKAMASSNIIQYESAVTSLQDYYYTVTLGVIGYLRSEEIDILMNKKVCHKQDAASICAIVFGSDQGLVGQFNDLMSVFVREQLAPFTGKKEIWAVGERVQLLLSDFDFTISRTIAVPTDVNGITPAVNGILNQCASDSEKDPLKVFCIFHHQPKQAGGYQPVMQQFLPIHESWKQKILELYWPTKLPPQIAGNPTSTLLALVHEYMFVTLFKTFSESLSSENASRLEAMERAEKNISDLLENIDKKFHRLRQSSIDEELFEVMSGYESLQNAQK